MCTHEVGCVGWAAFCFYKLAIKALAVRCGSLKTWFALLEVSKEVGLERRRAGNHPSREEKPVLYSLYVCMYVCMHHYYCLFVFSCCSGLPSAPPLGQSLLE